MFEEIDWDRLVSERETTAAALSVALQRRACLRKEISELEQELVLAEGRGRGELGVLRTALRQLTCPENTQSKPAQIVSADDLFRHRLEDLQDTTQKLHIEVQQAQLTKQHFANH